jgi:hypothetical protein
MGGGRKLHGQKVVLWQYLPKPAQFWVSKSPTNFFGKSFSEA